MTLDSASNVSYAMAALGATELPEAPPLTAPQLAAQESVAQAEAGHALALELIGLGITVISLPRALKGEDGEYVWPARYTEWLADVKHVAKWKAGHGLAMIGGHGLDGIDVDTKHGASVDAERARLLKHGVLILGEVRTPSGGAHFYVLSSGLRSTNGGKVSEGGTGVDTRMGAQDGQGRGPLFMPGTFRPKYGGLGYTWVQPLDLEYVRACLGDPELRLTQTMAITAYMAEIGALRPTRKSVPTVAPVSAEPISPVLLSQALQDDLRATEWAPSTSGVGRRAGRFMHLVGHCYRAGLTQGQALTLLAEWNADPERGSDKYTGRLPEQLAHCWAIAIADSDAWKASKAGKAATGKDVPRTSLTSGSLEDVQGPAQDDGPPSTWLPVDLGPLLDGTYVQPVPTVGRREDGVCLFYAGETHQIFGEPGSGKSLVAQAVAVEVLQAGGRVCYLDFESRGASVVARLRALGATVEQIGAGLDYIRPDSGLTAVHDLRAYREVLARTYTLAVIDGVTEAMALVSGQVNGTPDAPVVHFNRQLSRALADCTGAAVVMIDHVTKSKDTRGRYSYGSQHKLGVTRGTSFAVNALQLPLPGRIGKVELRLTKDNEGGLGPHCGPVINGTQHAATFTFNATGEDGQTTVQVQAPSAEGEDRGPFRPTVKMEQASRALEGAGEDLSQVSITSAIGGNKTAGIAAITVLVSEGYVHRFTKGRAVMHRSLKPYRQVQDPLSDCYVSTGTDSP